MATYSELLFLANVASAFVAVYGIYLRALRLRRTHGVLVGGATVSMVV